MMKKKLLLRCSRRAVASIARIWNFPLLRKFGIQTMPERLYLVQVEYHLTFHLFVEASHIEGP